MAFTKVILLGVLLAVACGKSAEKKKTPITPSSATSSMISDSTAAAAQSPAAQSSPSGADSFPQEPPGFRSIHQLELAAHKSDSARTDSSTFQRP